MIAMDERTANAVEHIASHHEEEWALIEHYFAENLCQTRDKMEIGSSHEQMLKMSGECRGLRVMFLLRPRARAALEGEKFAHGAEIVGEEAYVTRSTEEDRGMY